MQPASIPHNEDGRLKALRALNILDSIPSDSYDRVTRLVARRFDMPIALVSLVDQHRQWFKSRVGIDASETPRDQSFCAHVVFDRQALVVVDASADERFADNPLVTGDPHIRTYVGIPLFSREGFALGSLCVIDNKTRPFSEADQALLSDYAKIVEDFIHAHELTQNTAELIEFATEREKLFRDTFDQAAVGITHSTLDGDLIRVNDCWCHMLGYKGADAPHMSMREVIHPDDVAAYFAIITSMTAGDVDSYRFQARLRCKDATYLWTDVSVALKRGAAEHVGYVISVIADISAQKKAQFELLQMRDTLNSQVREKTALLQEANQALQRQVDQARNSEEKAREAVRELQHFHYALDQHASVAVTDLNGVITFANERFCQLSEYSANELIGHTHAIVKSDVHPPALFADLWQTILAGSMWRGELCNRSKTGRYYWVDTSIVPYKDEAGKIKQFVSIRMDITQRKLDRDLLIAEEARSRQINDRLRQISDSLPAMISYWNKERICLFANAAHHDRFGLSPKDIVGMSAERLLGEEFDEARRRRIDDALRGERQSFDISGATSDGLVRHWQIEYIPHWLEKQVVGFYSLVVNITERKLAEQTVARQEAMLAATSRMGEIGGWELERGATAPRWSDMVYRIHEVTVGQPPILSAALECYPAEWRRVVEQSIQAAFEEARSFDFVAPFITATGRHRWVRCIGEPQVVEGHVTHIIGALQDVTEHKLLESDLAQARRLESIGQLSAGIAHEINTPTQFIGNNIGFLKDAIREIFGLLDYINKSVEASGDGRVEIAKLESAMKSADLDYLLEEVPRAIEQAAEGVDRIQKIVGAMKDFSHPAVDRGMVDLNRAISGTIIVASNEWKYVADIKTHFDENLPPVFVMPGSFNQVILNMIVNAAHAVGDAMGANSGKGTITLTTRRIDNWAEIRIQDTGCGIPNDIRDRIFDPFFTTKSVGKGTGQGLAIAYDVIVKKHGGAIALESELGVGTTFILRLPIQETNSDACAAI